MDEGGVTAADGRADLTQAKNTNKNMSVHPKGLYINVDAFAYFHLVSTRGVHADGDELARFQSGNRDILGVVVCSGLVPKHG